MFIVVQHQIMDPATFWKDPENFIKTLPQNLKLHSVFGNKAGDVAVCLWECDSLNNLRSFLEKETMNISKNQYFEVDTQRSMGMPDQELAA
jgi:hypothetical protein